MRSLWSRPFGSNLQFGVETTRIKKGHPMDDLFQCNLVGLSRFELETSTMSR